ncbi:MAG: aryl-sulfate sulfotransferase [Bacteroidota bacterium]
MKRTIYTCSKELIKRFHPWQACILFLLLLSNCKKKFQGPDIVPGICTEPNGSCPEFQSLQYALNPSGNAPLTAVISVTANQPVTLSYTVKGQDGEDFSFSNNSLSVDYDTAINLFGLYPGFTNTVVVSIANKDGFIVQKTLSIATSTLPADVPQANEIIVNARNSGILSKFIMLFPNKFKALSSSLGANTIAIDTYGKVRWYFTNTALKGKHALPLKNGHWLVMLGSSFVEVDLMGNIIKTIPVFFKTHHDVCIAANGDLIYLGDSDLNNTIEDKVYRVNYNTGALIDSINIFTILDPLRPQMPVGPANDWLHTNSISYDAVDNSIIVSGRQQSAVFKIDLATKQLRWILADTTGWNNTLKTRVLKSSGANFEHSWGQHSAILKPGDHNAILVFDNGNSRSYTHPLVPTANYSRCVEYTINEEAKTVVQNFEFGKSYGAALFAPYISNVQYLTSDRMFINYGGIYKDIANNATELDNPNGRNQVRIFETDRNRNVYFDISIKNPNTAEPQLIGFMSYRAYSFSFQ